MVTLNFWKRLSLIFPTEKLCDSRRNDFFVVQRFRDIGKLSKDYSDADEYVWRRDVRLSLRETRSDGSLHWLSGRLKQIWMKLKTRYNLTHLDKPDSTTVCLTHFYFWKWLKELEYFRNKMWPHIVCQSNKSFNTSIEI